MTSIAVREPLPRETAWTTARPCSASAAMSAALTRMLATHYRVEAVADSLAACHAAQDHPPDAAVVDLCVPGTDHLALIRSLRAETRTALLPIIMLTASTHRELLLRCLTAGASNFLRKPFNTSELLTCVRLELERRGPLAEPPLASGASHDC